MLQLNNKYTAPKIGARGQSTRRTGSLPRRHNSERLNKIFALCWSKATGRRKVLEPFSPFIACGHKAYLVTQLTRSEQGAEISKKMMANRRIFCSIEGEHVCKGHNV